METNGLNVDFVSFVRYSTSTHSTNTDQRLVELKVVGRTRDTVYVEAPRDGAMAPPGNFFLFALNDGKPSVGATILLGAGEVTTVEVPEDAKSNAPVGSSASLRVGIVVFVAIACLL